MATSPLPVPPPTPIDLISKLASKMEAPAKIAVGLASIGTVLATLSTAVGMLEIRSYLRSLGAPVPATDLLGLTWLEFLTSLEGTLVFAFLISLPLVAASLNKEFIDRVGAKRPNIIALLWCYVSWILWSITLLAWKSAFAIVVSAITALVAPALTCAACKFWPRANVVPSFPEVASITAGHFVLSVWLAFGLMLLSTVDKEISERETFVVIIVLLALAALALWPKTTAQTIATAGAVTILTFFLLVNFLSSVSLRMMGLGGDMPVSLLVKKTGEGSAEPRAIRVNGCLVLNTGSEVFIKSDMPLRECAPPTIEESASSLLGSPGQAPPLAYEHITRYSRTDVLETSEYPRIFWVDGSWRGYLGLAEQPKALDTASRLQYWKERNFRSIFSVDGATQTNVSGDSNKKEEARFASEETEAQRKGLTYLRFPLMLPNRGAPSASDEAAFIDVICRLEMELHSGTNILLEGNRAYGTASFIAVSILVGKERRTRITPDEAIQQVSALLGRLAVETDDQRSLLDKIAVRSCGAPASKTADTGLTGQTKAHPVRSPTLRNSRLRSSTLHRRSNQAGCNCSQTP